LIDYLEEILSFVDIRVNASVSEVFVDDLLDYNRVLVLRYRHYNEDEDYALWDPFSKALFVLEDNLDNGLEGYVFIREYFVSESKNSSYIIRA
jgi:hypothetical protein